MTFPATAYVASLVSTFLGVWASFVTLWGAYVGFVTLARGGTPEEVVAESQLGTIAAVPRGFLVAIAATIFEVAT